VAFNPSSVERICVRATNWLGDAVMSLPALRVIRDVFPHARLAVIARPSVAGIYERESYLDEVILYNEARSGLARKLRARRFDCAILLQNAFDAALLTWLAGIPERIGYRRDGRGLLLTRAVPVPEPGEIPRHERFYYLELLRRAGLLERFPACDAIRLDRLEEARAAGRAQLAEMGIADPPVGISPGAAYGGAKRWPADRFIAAAKRIADGPVLVFGAPSEAALCESVASEIPGARSLAGRTTLARFIELASACRLFLTNDSGAMHVASAAGVPTVAIFGATDDTTTGPTGPLARVVREHAECSPCLLRECPIDHRCMTRVTPERVAAEARELLRRSEAIGAPDP
jgi:lipopolysaccharide heptosyltransferase II